MRPALSVASALWERIPLGKYMRRPMSERSRSATEPAMLAFSSSARAFMAMRVRIPAGGCQHGRAARCPACCMEKRRRWQSSSGGTSLNGDRDSRARRPPGHPEDDMLKKSYAKNRKTCKVTFTPALRGRGRCRHGHPGRGLQQLGQYGHSPQALVRRELGSQPPARGRQGIPVPLFPGWRALGE